MKGIRSCRCGYFYFQTNFLLSGISIKIPYKNPAGKKKKEMYFRFGHWYLGLYPTLHTGQKRITEEIPLRITENFILPYGSDGPKLLIIQ